MLKLTDREWKEFKICDVFEVMGTITTKPESLLQYGDTPRVTCSASNNGYDDFYKNNPTENGKCLTVDSAAIGSIMYQNNDFIATDHVEKLIIIGKEMNRYTGLFLKTVIDNCCSNKYSYGYKFSQNRIKQQHILLPITSSGEPDWQFMEDYAKERENKILSKYKLYKFS